MPATIILRAWHSSFRGRLVVRDRDGGGPLRLKGDLEKVIAAYAAHGYRVVGQSQGTGGLFKVPGLTYVTLSK